MRTLEVSLIEWPNGPEHGGPRLLGRSADPGLVSAARERIAADGRKALAEIEGGAVRLTKPVDGDDRPRSA